MSAPYVRKRAYSKIHLTSWIIYLEKNGYVRCSFKNCNFMGFDVEEICNHYGYCSGDNAPAKYVCSHCNGCTDDKKKFELHLARAHNDFTPTDTIPDSEPEPKSTEADRMKPSRVLQQSWGYFFDQYNYIKCSTCDYLANTQQEMVRHFSVCKKEKELLLYVCSECKGRTMSVNPLLWHLERSHKIFKNPAQFNHINRSMVSYWVQELNEKGHASCLHITKGKRDCFYFNTKLLGIVEHAQCCKGPKFSTTKEQCPTCKMWTTSNEMLKIHIDLTHNRFLYDNIESSEEEILPTLKEDIVESTYEQGIPIETVQTNQEATNYNQNKPVKNASSARDGKIKVLDGHLFTISTSKNEDLCGNQEFEVGKIIDGIDSKSDTCQTELHNGDVKVFNSEQTKSQTEETTDNSNVILESVNETTVINTIGSQKEEKNSSYGTKIKDDIPSQEEIKNGLKEDDCGMVIDSKEIFVNNENNLSQNGNVINSVKSFRQNSSQEEIEEDLNQDDSGMVIDLKETFVKDESNLSQKGSVISSVESFRLISSQEEIEKELNEDDCGMVIDLEENLLENENNLKQEHSHTSEEFRTYANNPITVLEEESKTIKTGKMVETAVREKYLSLPGCSQDGLVSKNILKDWDYSEDDASNDGSLEGSDAEEVSGSKLLANIVDDCGEVSSNNGLNVKELSDRKVKDKDAGKDKSKCPETKQPCLFEDSLLSDDSNSIESVEEFDEFKVKISLSDDDEKPNTCITMPLKNYLKRQGATDPFRQSPARGPRTYVRSNRRDKYVLDADINNMPGVSNKYIKNTKEIIPTSQIRTEKCPTNKNFKSDVEQFPESFVKTNLDSDTDQTSRNSEKNDKLMHSKSNTKIIGDISAPTSSLNSVIRHEEITDPVKKTDRNDSSVPTTSSNGIRRHEEINYAMRTHRKDNILVKVPTGKLPGNKTNPPGTESLERLDIFDGIRRKGKRGDSVLKTDSRESPIYMGNQNKSPSKGCSREKLNKQCATISSSVNKVDPTEPNSDCAVNKESNSHSKKQNHKENYGHKDFQNLVLSPDSRDVPRRISSEWSDDSMDEDFLGTDEEPDMRLNAFNGFQEVSEESCRHRRKFQQFLNRLSESETEEWYINAGSLSMEVKKEEKRVYGKSNSKAIKSDKGNKLKGDVSANKPSECNFSVVAVREIENSKSKIADNAFKECPEHCVVIKDVIEGSVEKGEQLKAQNEYSASNASSCNTTTEENPELIDDSKCVINQTQNAPDLTNCVTEIKLMECNSKVDYNIVHLKNDGGYLEASKNTNDKTELSTSSVIKELRATTTLSTEGKTETENKQKLINVEFNERNGSTQTQAVIANFFNDKLRSLTCNKQLSRSKNEDKHLIFDGRPRKTLTKSTVKCYPSKRRTISSEEEEIITGYCEIDQDVSKELNSTNRLKIEDTNTKKEYERNKITGPKSYSSFIPKMNSTPTRVTEETNFNIKEDRSEKNKESALFTNKLTNKLPSTSSPNEKSKSISAKEILSNSNEKDQSSTNELVNRNIGNSCNSTKDSSSIIPNVIVNADSNMSSSHSPNTPLLPRKRGRPKKAKCQETSEIEKERNAKTCSEVLLKKMGGASKAHCEDELLVSMLSDDIVNLFQVNASKSQITSERLLSLSTRENVASASDSEKRSLNLVPTAGNTNVPVKKKRGRPPKIKVPLDTQIPYSPVENYGTALNIEGDSISSHSFDTNKSTISELENSKDSAKSLLNNVSSLKKRGRPPLNSTSSPKKRGRPPLNSTSSPKKRGRPPKSSTHLNLNEVSKQNCTNTSIHNVLIKRRGRPPKLKPIGEPQQTSNYQLSSLTSETSFVKSEIKDMMTIDDSNDSVLQFQTLKSESSLDVEAKPPNLQIKTYQSNRNNSLGSEIYPTGKRKVGRPPKKKLDQRISQELTPKTELDESIKEEPDVNESNENQSLESSNILNSENDLSLQGTVKRKRGRPPKSKSSQSGAASEETPPPKRKRPKNMPTFDDSETDNNDSDEDNSSQLLETDVILINDKYKSNAGEKMPKKPIYTRKSKDNRPRPAQDTIFIAKHKGTDRVTCGMCKQEMSYQQYRASHSLNQHYALSWIEDEEPPFAITNENEKEVLKRLWFTKKSLKKVIFRCFHCNLPKLSAVGFLSHIKFCGKESEERESLLVACEMCGAKMMPSSIKPHMYIKHNSSTGTPQASKIDKTFIIPKSKRAAANRAVEVIQSHADEDGDEPSKRRRSVSPTSKPLMARLYIKPNKMIPPEMYRRCQHALREEMVFPCQYEGCKLKFNTTLGFRKHYLSCPFGPERLYKCRPCSFTSKSEKEMLQHIEENHEALMQTPNWEDSDKSEDSDGESRPNSYNPSHHFKFLQQPKNKCRGIPRKFYFTDALKWTFDLRERTLAKDMLFSESQVGTNAWQPLSLSSSTPYLPALQTSVQFRGKDKTWHTLRRFEGTLVDGVPVIFAGGPVWALSWAPVPDAGSDHQFLALATHPNMELTHELATVYNYKSIIQIWCFGHLNISEPSSGETPKFLLGLAHSRGAVWALRWCPSGCFSDTRLGLLAAACSDGSIAIYSVPRFRYSFESVSQYTIYDVKPVMELRLGCEMLSQALSLDWHSVAPHNIIAGGFANGMVALWDLNTSSALLRSGNTIYPYKFIEAHHSAVTAVSLSPSKEGIHLMTGSLDRATKFWRLDDTSAPVNTIRKASVTDAVMPKNWMTSICGYDDVYSLNSLHVTGYNYRETYTVGNTNYLLQSGTVWSLSFNDWLNACACASELGKVTLFYRKQILVTEDAKKVKNHSMVGDIVNCSIQPIDSSKKPEELPLGHVYSDCVSKVGLDICFTEEIVETPRPSSACSSDVMDRYPLQCINKVAWNPNLTSFTWLAVGMQCGLVMAPRTRCQNFDLADLLKTNTER